MKLRAIAVAAVTATTIASANAQLMADDRLSTAHFPISCSPVQDKFDRAVPPPSERSPRLLCSPIWGSVQGARSPRAVGGEATSGGLIAQISFRSVTYLALHR
jgi:hypothetical protein